MLGPAENAVPRMSPGHGFGIAPILGPPVATIALQFATEPRESDSHCSNWPLSGLAAPLHLGQHSLYATER